MFTDYWDNFQREGLQQGSTQILQHLPPPTKKDKRKQKPKDRLGFRTPADARPAKKRP